MYKLFYLLLLSILPSITFAQKYKKLNYTFSKPATILVDANILDWTDGFIDVSEDFWSFAVTQQKNDLFVAIVIKNLQLQREAFRGGLFVDISYDGKKKSGAKLQFPYWDGERRRALLDLEQTDSKNIADELLSRVNGYLLTGFGRVRDGVLALDNDYGINAKVKIDSNKCLIFEACIPLQLVGLKSDEITINLGVNTQYGMLKKASMNTNNRNLYPMMGRQVVQSTPKNPYAGDTDVWVYDKNRK